MAVEDANTSPPTSPTRHPAFVVLGSSPERVAVRLRHTFSLGLTDRGKMRSSGGSPTLGSDELAAKMSSVSPDNVRKRFSIGNGGKRASSTLKLDSSIEMQEVRFESPAISTPPSDNFGYNIVRSFDRVQEPTARWREYTDDTASLQSGQNKKVKTNAMSRILIYSGCWNTIGSAVIVESTFFKNTFGKRPTRLTECE